MAEQSKDSSLNQSPDWKCFKILISGYLPIPTGCFSRSYRSVQKLELQKWQLHKKRCQESGGVVLAEVSSHSDTEHVLCIFSHQALVFWERAERGKGDTTEYFLCYYKYHSKDTMDTVQELRLCLYHSACQTIYLKVVFWTMSLRSQALSESFILNAFVLNKKMRKFLYLEDD